MEPLSLIQHALHGDRAAMGPTVWPGASLPAACSVPGPRGCVGQKQRQPKATVSTQWCDSCPGVCSELLLAWGQAFHMQTLVSHTPGLPEPPGAAQQAAGALMMTDDVRNVFPWPLSTYPGTPCSSGTPQWDRLYTTPMGQRPHPATCLWPGHPEPELHGTRQARQTEMAGSWPIPPSPTDLEQGRLLVERGV